MGIRVFVASSSSSVLLYIDKQKGDIYGNIPHSLFSGMDSFGPYKKDSILEIITTAWADIRKKLTCGRGGYILPPMSLQWRDGADAELHDATYRRKRIVEKNLQIQSSAWGYSEALFVTSYSNPHQTYQIKKRQQELVRFLEGNKIEFEEVDITMSEEQRQWMYRNIPQEFRPAQGNPLPPQIFNDDRYCGDYDSFFESKESNTVFSFLGLKPRPNTKQTAEL